MSQFDSYQSTYGQPIEEKPRGRSKLLLGILIGCGGMILLCCGGGIGLVFFIFHWANETVENDPVTIRNRGSAIATLDIPAAMEPKVAIHVSFPVLGDLANIVVYEDSEREAYLILADVREDIADGKSAEEWVDEIRRQGHQVSLPNHRDLEISETELIQHTVRGTEATFSIQTGQSKENDSRHIIATGNFPGKLGNGFFRMTGKADTLTIDDVKKVIQSIE